MLVGEAPIRWWNGSTFLSPKPGAILGRSALSLSLVFFRRILRVLPTPFILSSRRWWWLPMTFTIWPALASKGPSSVWTVCQESSWISTCWGRSTPLRPPATSIWCWITCSFHRGPGRNVFVWLGLSFSTCWRLISLPMVGKRCHWGGWPSSRTLERHKKANWGQACLTYLYSSFDTLRRGTLQQFVGPWKLFKVSYLFILCIFTHSL